MTEAAQRADSPTAAHWQEANQRYLSAALAQLAQRFRAAGSPDRGDGGETGNGLSGNDEPERTILETTGQETADSGAAGSKAEQETVELAKLTSSMAAPPALERLVEAFELSSFERDLILWCAGVELETEIARLSTAINPTGRPEPSFSLALGLLPEAHWSALSPAAPLRRWRFLELEGSGSLTGRALRIDERVLHFLCGVQYLDERLAGLVEPAPAGAGLDAEPVASHRSLAEAISGALRQSRPLPVVQLTGPDPQAKLAVAASAAAELGLDLSILRASALPTAPAELDGLVCLWEREAAMTTSALLLDGEDLDDGEGPLPSAAARFVDAVGGLLFVSIRSPRRPGRRPLLSYSVEAPSPREQEGLWRQHLGSFAPALNGHLEGLVGHFRLSTPMLTNAARQALAETPLGADEAAEEAKSGEPLETRLGNALWDACRSQCRPRIEHLAQRIETTAGWDDLVLPAEQKEMLRRLVTHVRHRYQVYEGWGFAAKGSRGLGISALFAGVSGTGKTLAAEVLAQELGLDLYRIDLASVISKYIGETEKNLRRIFDAAEHGGSVLLFDEADALFGKRSEVKDSHDRYANVEISYLLQRMEAYRGLAILTTNMKNALDTAFLRRLRFVVEFPFPDATQRQAIWQRIYPTETPLGDLDLGKLARLTVAGGNIRNIALAAAFAAAEDDAPVAMSHLLQAARAEYRKLEKPLSESEIRGWLS